MSQNRLQQLWSHWNAKSAIRAVKLDEVIAASGDRNKLSDFYADFAKLFAEDPSAVTASAASGTTLGLVAHPVLGLAVVALVLSCKIRRNRRDQRQRAADTAIWTEILDRIQRLEGIVEDEAEQVRANRQEIVQRLEGFHWGDEQEARLANLIPDGFFEEIGIALQAIQAQISFWGQELNAKLDMLLDQSVQIKALQFQCMKLDQRVQGGEAGVRQVQEDLGALRAELQRAQSGYKVTLLDISEREIDLQKKAALEFLSEDEAEAAVGVYDEMDSALRKVRIDKIQVLLLALEWSKAMTEWLAIKPQSDLEEKLEVASMFTLTGWHGYQAGLWNETLPLLEESLDIQRSILGERNLDTVMSINLLGNLYLALGRLAEAEAHTEKFLELAADILGDSHPTVGVAMSNLANLYSQEGRLSEAESLFKKAIPLLRLSLGEDQRQTLAAINNYCGLLGQTGRLQEAEALRVEQCELCRIHLGERNRYTLLSLSNLAGLYSATNRSSEALELYEEILPVERDLLGDMHPEVITTTANIANEHGNARRYQKAIPLMEEVVQKRRQVLGGAHPLTQAAESRLAHYYLDRNGLGDAPRAIALLEPLLSLQEKSLGENDIDTLVSMRDLGIAHLLLGRKAEADRLIKRAHAVSRSLPSDHPFRKAIDDMMRQVGLMLNGWTSGFRVGPPNVSAPVPVSQPDKPVDWARVGRTDPCPCGSGRRFRDCHYPELRAKGVI